MVDWTKILIHLAAWIIPGIWMLKTHWKMLAYCLVVFGGLAILSGELYPLFWAVYSFVGFLCAIYLKGWWRTIGLLLIPLTSWAVITYVFTGTIFWLR
ncbi:hypothetical protein GW927_01135 [Candidatus Pacearchaeota archaeon]|nr:hypothetical protein [Candidatus Pacearchaeota archaeon]